MPRSRRLWPRPAPKGIGAALFLLALALGEPCLAGAQAGPGSPGVRYALLPAAGSGILMSLDPAWLEEAPVPQRQDPKVLVLVYHNLVFGRTGIQTNRDIHNFESDLAFLRRRFRIVGIEELGSLKAGSLLVDSDLAVLTFDDGDLSVFAIAYPLLRRFGIKATFFIVPSLVGEVGYLSWDQVREIAAYVDPLRGPLFTIGSHTQSHEALGEVPREELYRQLLDSKLGLERELGRTVEALALPYGSGADRREIFEIAASLGYRIVRTLKPEARLLAQLDLMAIGAFSVDSSNSDLIVKKLITMVGR